MKKWFIDKVLPNIAVATIVAIATSFSIVLGTAIISQIGSVSQRWIPEGSYIFSNRVDNCPAGWRTMGRVLIYVDKKDRARFRTGDFVFDSKKTSEGYDALQLFTCMKGN